MELRKATEQDNDRLLKYFAQTALPGAVRLRYRRMFSFFNQYALQSDDFVTYVLEGKDKQIEAIASMIFREGIVNGIRQTIGYATDLRVSPNRRAIVSWSQHFLPILEEEKTKRNCQYMFSVVPHSQRQALNAFVRPRTQRRGLPRYYLFRRFQIVSLHGLWPFHETPLPGIRVHTAKESDFERIANYVLSKTSNRPLRFSDNVDDFRQSLSKWRDLYIENFLIATDRSDRIIGCVAPWNAERVQRVYVDNYSPKAENLRDVLKLMSVFRNAHPLPKPGEELGVKYLTHLHADNPDIFYSLLHAAYRQSAKTEVLLYPNFEGELLSMPPKSFVSAEMTFGLYSIMAPNDPIPDFLKPRAFHKPPVFEPAWI